MKELAGGQNLERRAVETALRLPERQPRRRSRWQRQRQRLADAYQSGELSRRLLVGTPLLAVGFAIWAFGGVYGWAYGLAYWLVFGGLAAWSAQYWGGRRRALWTPVYIPVLLFGGLAVAQYLGHWSTVPASTATALLHLSAAGALFFLLSQCYRGDRDAGWITASFAVFTAALALLAILQILTASNGIYWHFTYAYASPAGSFVNRNHFSGCMEMLLPVAGIAAYQKRHRGWILFLPWAAAPALGVAAVILAASRGGVAALAAEAVAGLGVLLYLGRAQPAPVAAAEAPRTTAFETAGWLPVPGMEATAEVRSERRQGEPHRGWHRQRATDPLPGSRGPARVVTILLALALMAGLVLVVGTNRLEARLQNTDSHAPSIEQRNELNLSSLAMFRARPVLGWGLGTWSDVYPTFARFTDTSVYAYAHNDYLQLLAETGLAGAACAALFWGLWGWELAERLRSWREIASGGRRVPASVPLAVAASISCLGILIHSWVDYNLHIPANLMLFFVMAALAVPSQRERPSD